MARPIRRAFLSTTISAVIVNGCYAAQLIGLTYLLSPQELGLATAALIVLGLLQNYTDAGFTNALIHFQNATQEQLNTIYAAMLGIGAILGAFLFFGAPALADFFRQANLKILLQWASIGLPIVAIGQQFTTLLNREMRFSAMAKIDTLSSFAGTVVCFAAVLVHPLAISVIWGYLAQSIFKTLLSVFYGRHLWRPSNVFTRQDVGKMLSFSLFQIGERTINYFFRNLDKFVIGKFLGPHALGIYNLAYQIAARPVSLVAPIFTRIATPLYARDQQNIAQLNQDCLALHQVQAVLFFPLAAGLFVLAGPLIRLILPVHWHDVGPILKALSPICALYALGNPLSSVLIAKGRADLGFYFNGIATVLYAVMMWIFVRQGLETMAYAISLATVLLVPIDIVIRRHLLAQTVEEYIRATGPAALAALIAGGLASFASTLVTYDGWKLGIGAVTGFGIYTGVLLSMRPTVLREMRMLWAGRF
jgi:O-antigen/teichoic acid export membrane protein